MISHIDSNASKVASNPAGRKCVIEIGDFSPHLDSMQNVRGTVCLVMVTGAAAGLILPLVQGCSPKSAPPGSGAAASSAPLPVGLDGKPFTPITEDGFGHKVPTQAQGPLPSIRLWLGAAEVTAEMAITPIQDQTGMMFRTNMPENNGMIFPLAYPQQASFWMANCPLPLTAAYIDPAGQIVEIHDLHSFDTNSVASRANNILYVLEMNKDWFTRHHIVVGTTVVTEHGTLQATFRRSQ